MLIHSSAALLVKHAWRSTSPEVPLLPEEQPFGVAWMETGLHADVLLCCSSVKHAWRASSPAVP